MLLLPLLRLLLIIMVRIAYALNEHQSAMMAMHKHLENGSKRCNKWKERNMKEIPWGGADPGRKPIDNQSLLLEILI